MKDNTTSMVKNSASKSARSREQQQTPRCPKCGKEIHSLIYGQVDRNRPATPLGAATRRVAARVEGTC